MLGALGACFGRVVTLDSPTAREPGTFNWGETLWHELAHVITLQLSGNRLPRWLSEGTSVFEERRARPDWGREMDIPFARAMDHGAVLKIKDLNSGFSSSQTINFAYYQASLIVEYVHDTYGQRKLRALIEAYADGSDTDAAIKKSLGIDMDELQKGFDQFLDKRYSALRAALKAPDGLKEGISIDALKVLAAGHPDNFQVQMALGEALAASNPDQAIAAFEKAAQIIPNLPGEDSPQAAIAAVALKKGDKVRAAKALETLIGYSHTDVQSARELVTLIDANKEPARLQLALKRVVSVDPFDGAAHSQLGRLALEANNTAEAVRLFRVALAAKPLDKASAHVDLAEALYKSGQRDEAKKQVFEALLIAPTYTRAQDLLLKLQEGNR
jgi:tetratricopeptide (TPR) repeat protein